MAALLATHAGAAGRAAVAVLAIQRLARAVHAAVGDDGPALPHLAVLADADEPGDVLIRRDAIRADVLAKIDEIAKVGWRPDADPATIELPTKLP